ncbi:MAG: hypothetical protein AB7O52_19085 [Planctomycetota bacterium]
MRRSSRSLATVLRVASITVTLLGAASAQTNDPQRALSFRSVMAPLFAAEPMDRTAESSMDGAAADSESKGLWPGFISGTRDGFESFPRPVGSPLYFEDPFINTDIRPLLLYHEFPKDSLLGGGDLTVLAVQARLALTERLQFIATGDGHADLESTALPEAEEWNDLAAGLKYAFYVDKEKQAIASVGCRLRLSSGRREVAQGLEDEVSLFITGAKKYGRLSVIADLVGRITTHHGKGNDSLSWDAHASYEVCEWFHPLVEYHGFYYLSNGDFLLNLGNGVSIPTAGLRDGLLDYGNLGAGDVAGSSAHWATVGFRCELKKGVSWGFGYGFALRRIAENDIFDRRITTNIVITF